VGTNWKKKKLWKKNYKTLALIPKMKNGKDPRPNPEEKGLRRMGKEEQRETGKG